VLRAQAAFPEPGSGTTKAQAVADEFESGEALAAERYVEPTRQATQEILLKVAADVSGAMAELAKLTEEGKKSSQSLVHGFTDIKAAVDMAASGFEMAKEAIADFARDSRNETAAAMMAASN
jgi:hypothetical protein